jgi:YidC/Oxa1 family membrane protein insertase
MQHEVWRIYRENKVNPLSSCLPMLLQIPVFFALYIMLRSAVELRYSTFLWVGDLSQPENLFASVLPIPINILPILMAATTIWQSKLTPSMGDPMQQKMMTWMMPLMMLFFFYSMPAGLSLYWAVSTLLAILQLIWQKRSGAGASATPPSSATADADDMTRQMKRRLER